ncbi:MAG: N-acetylmuramoyl-L-alanine amidase [Azoarcus sp.]|nr:N-acetylmuramoyl-L-alanine amidase [Azoarcus sp.]
MKRIFSRFSLSLALTLALAACVTLPEAGHPGAKWKPSPNFGVRKANFVILHHTSSDTLTRALATLTNPASQVSSHYLIDRDGAILQLVDENRRAWHAGESYWGGDTDLNSSSIGVELVNNSHEPFPEAQIAALLNLLADIKTRQNIPRANFIGHADVAPGRKTDPSALFPWRRLSQAGFGLWCDPPYPPPPPDFSPARALAVIGYDVSDPFRAIDAFKLHFAPGEGKDLSPEGEAMLYCLEQQVLVRLRY